ncbi:MAG: hypothetical protein IPP90_19830 [Gemmatimonadaceae bacterium]|nr:hypothetical protein [Gemmatimonadaceae bacterium]
MRASGARQWTSAPGLVSVGARATAANHDPRSPPAWARRWSASGQRGVSWFDVLNADGRYLRTVMVPADCTTLPAPVVRNGVMACVQLAPETDAETVVIARIPGRR